MYSIYADGVCIYNDVFSLDNMKMLNPKLTLEDSAAGSLEMTLPPTNAAYDTIVRMVTDISVKKNGEEVWAGRALSESRDFWNNRVLYCEGELAFFNDSVQPPAEYAGKSVREYLDQLIAVHNGQVGENRRFAIGAVTVVDEAFPTYYTNYGKTLESLNALVEAYGGHLRVRKADGVRYLDYLKDYPDTCSQVIQFGSNLLDFVRNWDSAEYATAIVPLGNRLDDSPIEALDAYLTVESVNGGSLYVQSDEAVASHGWIAKMVNWDDVSDPQVLLEKAREYLADLQFDNLELELSALDLHYLDVETEAVKLLDEIRVISRPHGLDRLFPVTRLEIPLDAPENTQFKMGDSVQVSLTSVSNQTNAAVLDKIENLPKAHNILKEAQENATHIMNMATTGYITITRDEHGSDTLYISNVRDYNSNVILDLDKGTLTMKKGSINIGNGNFTVDEQGNLYARRGTFAGTLAGAKGTFGGTVQAEDFLDKYGNSMMDLAKEKFTAGYLDLYGLTVTNKSTGAVTFAVGPTGLITINGQVTMGAGSTINWAQVNNQNIQSNPAYSLANNAYNLADDAYYEAELAYDRANRAYKLADSIEMPGYIKSTYIDQTTIRSPVIEGGEFYGEEFNIIAGSDFGSFNLYGPFGSSRYHMLAIEYFEGDAPLINIYSPCGGYITIGQRRNGIVYFEGIVDFSAADVQGLDLGTGA